MSKIIQDLNPAQELALAIKLAAEGHLNQKDKGGNPYILHPIKVMHYLKTDDYQLMAIGVMHDLLEDTDMIAADLVLLGFSQRVISGVIYLTKKPDQSPDEYLNGILSSYDAIRVKLCDLRHNTDVRRLKGIGHKDLLRIQKYHDMYVRLKKAKELHESLNDLSTGAVS
ncbi:hypothetical protein pEaSNUABM55_00237 [Erwinia phage pEa_SNUABM_55]|nr:hypothetical protein pEaSNUABM55_00237 [Erwinia phage pEa_SNUABM_55]